MISLLGNPMLLGLGADGASPIDMFLLQHPKPSSTNVAEFLKAYPPSERPNMAQALIARGVDTKAVAGALNWLEAAGRIRASWMDPQIRTGVLGGLALVSAAASAFHGYRRNQSIGWAVWWFAWGSVLPVFTPIIAVAQGFGKKKG